MSFMQKCQLVFNNCALLQSLPARGAWIEMHVLLDKRESCKSLPARGAWIEIETPLRTELLSSVAPRTGSVD